MSPTCLPDVTLSDDVLTLDVEDHGLRALQVQGGRVRWWAEAALLPQTVQGGCVADVPAVARVLRSLLAARAQDPGPLLVSFGGCGSMARLLTVSSKVEHLSQTILQQIHRDLAGDREPLYLSWQVLRRKNSWQKVLLLGIHQQVLETQLRALRAAGLSPQASPRPLALAHASSRSRAVVVNLEPESADIVVAMGQVPVIARSLSPVRGDEYQLFDWLAGEIRQIFDCSRVQGEAPLSGTEIFVGGSQLESPAARDRLASRLNQPCRPPDVALETPPDFPLARFLVNVGLVFCSTLPCE